MTAELRTKKSTVSLWVTVAILCLGMMFLTFVIVEYQRNIALVEQNEVLISNSAQATLKNNILNRAPGVNWGALKGDYTWIKSTPSAYWFRDGVQEFPWRRTSGQSSITLPPTWAAVWSEINSLASAGTVNEPRLKLLIAVKSALESNNESSITRSFEEYLAHKNALQLSPYQEVAFSLKLLELGATDHWSSELMHAILITGGNSEAPLFRPIVDILFRHANLFSTNEFDAILTTVKRYLETYNLSGYFLDDYVQHLNHPQFLLTPTAESLSNASDLVFIDDWLLRQSDSTVIKAEYVALTEELKLIENELIVLGVLDNNDSLALSNTDDGVTVHTLNIAVDKAQLNRDKRYQAIYLVLKIAMLLVLVALILLSIRLLEKNQLRRLEYLALREDFVKLVSHELKTPLTGIRAMAETLRKRIERGLSVQTYPERIINEADKLWYMVDNILGFNRVQSTGVIINLRPTNLRLLCENVIDESRSFASKPYSVNNNVSERTEVKVDPELFSLVVKNIAVNAGLYNNNDTVELTLNYNQQDRSLLLSDNGIGIDSKFQFEVFKPFVRLTQSDQKSSRRSGTGLGLAICKRIMQLHDGDLSLAHSSSRGSVWKITISN
ncbi:hypothetical protein NBRC116583_18150 [Arenicella sp. 4NH20-0111]|uniref:sensor histidine kinase n=1 Tax=Arenicella sp. 4NH20-0111 TaxID=3127648 RepID=UPI003104C947